MKSIPFTKMHGLGNDYVYVDAIRHPIERPEELAVRISDRHFGVGGDGLVLILPSGNADFRMRMFNADGSEAQMCGNAVRCIGRYVYERKLTERERVLLETKAGTIELDLRVKGETVESVRVDMGEPVLSRQRIPTTAGSGERVVEEAFRIGEWSHPVTCVSMGNPHAIFFVDEITDELVLGLGPLIERDDRFPERTNVEFARIVDQENIELRVWERGSGETLACGTGAAATAVAAALTGRTGRTVTVKLPGGALRIEWDESTNRVFQEGPAQIVFDGTYYG